MYSVYVVIAGWFIAAWSLTIVNAGGTPTSGVAAGLEVVVIRLPQDFGCCRRALNHGLTLGLAEKAFTRTFEVTSLPKFVVML